ncbi:MAG: murein biosynthesis integral membrane protein MurJ [Candidatus Levybacteria bacterium]|nr:murein biosynthesis integral membrane protein MurJ [Candidatus Levybacteria bacterium]
MAQNFIKRGLNILLARQTNILSAAFIIMSTIILSQVLGLVRQRLLVGIFGASNTLGVYLASSRLPDLLFQLIIAGALISSFIPVFSNFLSKNKNQEAYRMASSLLAIGFVIFFILSLILFILAPLFLKILNLGAGFSPSQMNLMVDLMRIIVFGQLLFIVGTFFSVLLQSYNHFFIPGIAAALYNLGIIIGIIFLSSSFGIFAPALGMIIGALFFIFAQVPMIKKVGFIFKPSFSFKVPGVLDVFHLMWPKTLSLAVFQLGTLATVTLVSFLPNAGRNYVIFDYAQTLAFAPVALFGQAIAQAAFPILSREREKMQEFKSTFITSFNQMLYLVLPISVLFLVLRIPIVRLIYGAGQFDWAATVLTGKTLALFSVSIFAQSLIALISRGFYALYDTKTPLIIGTISTLFLIFAGYFSVLVLRMGIESIAMSYSLGSILNLSISLIIFYKKIGGLGTKLLFFPTSKIFLASFFTGIALYVPIKLLDQLVFDTTRTINLIFLTGISSFIGLSFYLFLTWLFNVKEATTFLLIFRKIGNWKEVLDKSEEIIEGPNLRP